MGGDGPLRDSGEFRKEYHASLSEELRRCLAPVGAGPPCANRVENRPHSFQNATVLEALQFRGHVVMPVPERPLPQTGRESRPGRPLFRCVGRNSATTFTGLCKDHDDRLFAPIEKGQPLVFDAEQKFLLAYREVLREIHASMLAERRAARQAEAAARIGSSEEQAIASLQALKVRTERHRRSRLAPYKGLYDAVYLAARHDSAVYGQAVLHDLVRLTASPPKIAASSTFFAARPFGVGAVFSVFPHDGRHVALLSYIGQHAGFGRAVSAELRGLPGVGRWRAVSTFVLEHCENLVVTPAWWDSLPEIQKVTVTRHYVLSTASDPAPLRDDPRLNLFEAVAW